MKKIKATCKCYTFRGFYSWSLYILKSDGLEISISAPCSYRSIGTAKRSAELWAKKFGITIMEVEK
jgi:hypothetical protein